MSAIPEGYGQEKTGGHLGHESPYGMTVTLKSTVLAEWQTLWKHNGVSSKAPATTRVKLSGSHTQKTGKQKEVGDKP